MQLGIVKEKTVNVCQIGKKTAVIVPRDILPLYPGGKLREKLVGGVWHTSQNPHHMYDLILNQDPIPDPHMVPPGLNTQNDFKTLFCFTDLNPCLDVHCPSFGVCKTFSAHEARCVCYEDCPSYHDPVCTANGTTYDNKCWHELYYCRWLENNLVYHPGSCEGREGFLLT